MKKIFYILFFTILSITAIAQTETFDIASYPTLKNWKKTASDGTVTYTTVNTTTGGFCLLTIYSSTVSSGDAQTDFKVEWKDLLVTSHNADSDPKTETQVSDGWKIVTGSAAIKAGALDAYAILTVFSGYQKKFSIVTTLNDQSYITGIDSFFKSITLNKMAKPGVATNTNTMPVITGARSQFGSMLYTAPKNWNITKYADGDILMPVNIPDKEFLEIWIQPSISFPGTLEQALQKSFDETVIQLKATKMNEAGGGNYTKLPVKQSFRGWEYIRCSGGIHMGGGEYPLEYGLDLFVIKINNRFERVAIVQKRSNCGISSYYSYDRIRYHNDIENFLFSLQFDDWKEPPVKPGSVKGAGIIGVWRGIGFSVGITKTGADLGAELKVKQAVFFSNGQAYFGPKFPLEGLDGLDTWIAAEQNRRDWGTYSFNNGSGILKLAYATIPIKMVNTQIVITTDQTNHTYIKLNPVDGAVFNGNYVLSSKNITGQETGKTPLLQFTPDGKFTDDGAIKILNHVYEDCLNDGLQPGSGTYQVKNYSVIFNYTDGRRIKLAFFGTDYTQSNQSPPILSLSSNEDILKKQ